MAEQTNIEWCDSTFNPWIGCTRVSPACDDCYAARSTPARTLGLLWGPGEQRRRTSTANWKQPLQWERQHANFMTLYGRRRRVFCASLGDVFDNEVPDEWRAELFRLIAQTPHLDWLLLTKRIGNVGNMLPVPFDFDRLYPNVWLGATVVNQAEADRDVPKLLQVPARVRFLSIEPMLGHIDLSHWLDRCDHGSRPGPGGNGGVACSECGGTGHRCARLHWIICGGESGPKARPMHPNWARSLREQCAAAGVPFLFKQWGEFLPVGQSRSQSADLLIPRTGHAWNDGATAWRVGKNFAGRSLDGKEHDACPA